MSDIVKLKETDTIKLLPDMMVRVNDTTTYNLEYINLIPKTQKHIDVLKALIPKLSTTSKKPSEKKINPEFPSKAEDITREHLKRLKKLGKHKEIYKLLKECL